MPTAPPSNPYFRLVVVAGGLFAITVMSMLAATFGDSRAPPNRFFSAYGIPLIVAETAIFAAVAIQALRVDRRQTLAAQRKQAQAAAAQPSAPPHSQEP